jgi:DNA-directed RNA polymerase specialized sigma24 family protein
LWYRGCTFEEMAATTGNHVSLIKRRMHQISQFLRQTMQSAKDLDDAAS